MNLVQRHRMPIHCRFEWSLGLAFAFPQDVLRPLVPPGLVLDTYADLGFLAIVLVHTRELRPAFVPEGFGLEFFLAGYRIFTRYEPLDGEILRGLTVLRTDTNHRVMCRLGNVLTHYNYHMAKWEVQRTNSACAVRISTPDRAADLEVEVDLRGEGVLPSGSPFPDVDEAREFAAPLLYTFDYEPETRTIVRVEGIRERWNPRPVTVKNCKSNFLLEGARLANAFWIEDVRYGWSRGVRDGREIGDRHLFRSAK